MVLSRILIALLALLSDGSEDGSTTHEEGHSAPEVEEFPLLMQTKKDTIVRHAMMKRSAVTAKVYRDAVVRVASTGSFRGCKRGWMKRMGGGYICRKNLKRTDETEPRPSHQDKPDLIDGYDVYRVANSGPKLYRNLKAIKLKNPYVRLRKGSVLVVRDELEREGISYLKTRQGWYVEADGLEKLPPRIDTLAIDIESGSVPPLGLAIKDVDIFSTPSREGEVVGRLERWAVIPREGDEDAVVEDGWIRLAENRYVEDDLIARYREAPLPTDVGEDERTIVVDLAEQMLQAYEGERLVKMVPCSTGKRGNTKPGNFRVQLKRRAQNMRLRMGTVRVEDVQWVMYYDRKAAIAIHSAFWHHDFGTPVSHGCVNLPIQDARWLFEWSAPEVVPEDSERFPVPGNPGSRVIVFM